IAGKYEGVYAAVGIHPHHVFDMITKNENGKTKNYNEKLKAILFEIETLILERKVVAVGEVGMDKHVYEMTKYPSYQISDEFIELQKELFRAQIKLAIQHNKSLILHNREAKKEFLQTLRESWDEKLSGRTVFHCCEPDPELLRFAVEYDIFIGVDGDVTYNLEKQSFVKTIPIERLVLETDSPFLLPEPLRSQKKYPNLPQNIPLIAEYIAEKRGENIKDFINQTTRNAESFYNIQND
ncbi:MAG: TatD family hydrolase, partial [Patescibacteria group bacterium]